MLEEIKNFLNQENTVSIFTRRYSLTFLLAIYDAYIYQFENFCECKIANVLVHQNKKGFFEFVVDFADYNVKIVEKINNKKFELLHKGVEQYYQDVEQMQSLIKQGYENANLSDKEIFELSSRILTFEAITFIVHFVDKDLHMTINDKELLEKCEKARLDTEKLFVPGEAMDKFLAQVDYLPDYLKNYDPNAREFILFNNEFINDQELISKILELKKERLEKQYEQVNEIKGNVAYKGKVKGKVKVIFSPEEFNKFEKGDILVASGTTPDYMPVIKMAGAIVSDEGGYLCHASIVSRELKIPCIVGTQVGTKVLKDGMEIEVDADKGIVRILK